MKVIYANYIIWELCINTKKITNIGLSLFPSSLFSLQSLYYYYLSMHTVELPYGSVIKNLPANAEDTRDMGLIPGLGVSL